MRNRLSKPFLPVVTVEQMAAFDKENPETFTSSPLMNAVGEALQVLGMVDGWELADYLRLNQRELSAAIKVATGMKYMELRQKVEWLKVDEIIDKHPDWKEDRIAAELGFKSRATIWRLKNRIKQKSTWIKR